MNKKVQLFCIPYAGGNAELFDEFASCFNQNDNIDVIQMEYAGHGKRRKEPFYEDFQTMVEDMAGCINERICEDAKVAVFGYSMGSIVAYELFAQNLLKQKPDYMFFASHEAPDVEWDSKQYYGLDEEQFFYMIQQMGGFEKCSVDMLKNRFFRKLHFEPVKVDYELLGNYKMSKKVVVDVPAMVFYSSADIPTEDIMKWKDFLREGDEIIEMGDSHFFIREHAKDMACFFSHSLV